MTSDPKQSLMARDYCRELENPYALEQIDQGKVWSKAQARFLQGADEPPLVELPNERPPARATAGVSKRAFGQECRRIFRQFIPPAEKGRLRQVHREFVRRNEIRPAGERQLLLEALERYDLKDHRDLRFHFNRERDELTAVKLQQLEQEVLQGL